MSGSPCSHYTYDLKFILSDEPHINIEISPGPDLRNTCAGLDLKKIRTVWYVIQRVMLTIVCYSILYNMSGLTV